MALAPAIALLAAEGLARGFGPYDKTMMAALWFAPLLARTLPQMTHIPFAVPVMLAGLALTLHHAAAPLPARATPLAQT